MDRGFIKKRLVFWYSLLWVFLVFALYFGYGAYFVDLAASKLKWIGFFAAVIALLFAVCKISESLLYFYKDDFIAKLSLYFSRGANVYSVSRNKILFILSLILLFALSQFLGFNSAISFVVGVIFALLADVAPAFVSTCLMPRIYRASKDSLNYAFKLALNSGIISSMSLVAIAVCGVTALYFIFKDYNVLYSFLLGISLVTLLNTTQSAIVKKACTDASSIISKFDSNIIENDKRNPILLLKGISKTVLEFGSRISDGLQSYVAIIVASITIGVITLNTSAGVFLPLVVVSGGIFASIIALLLLKMTKSKNPTMALYTSCFGSVVLIALVSYFTMRVWFSDYMAFYKVLLTGIFAGYFANFFNFNYVFENHSCAKNVANASISGISTVLIQALKEGFKGILSPVLILGVLIVSVFLTSEGLTSPITGIYGISLCALGFISSFAVMMTILGFGFVSDRYNNLAETFEQNLVREDNALTSKGFSLVALSESYMNISAVFAIILLFVTYSIVFELWQIDILNPYVMFSMLIGSLVSFAFCSGLISATSTQAKNLALEAKRQFKSFPQILRYEMCPDFEKSVKISAYSCASTIIFYTLIIISVFALIAFYLKMEAIGGFFAGLILPSIALIFLACATSNVVKSAKKVFVDSCEELYVLNQADEVLDAIRDVIAPNLKSLIKFLVALALAIVPLFM